MLALRPVRFLSRLPNPPTPNRTPTIPHSRHGLETRSEQARHRLDRALAQATVTPAQLDLIDKCLLWLCHR